jgi:CRISPR-associated protein Cmr2
MGPATHVGLNPSLLDFSDRLVPYLTERRFCGRVIYSGGDDVMVVMPLEDLPEYLMSLRAAWCGDSDPYSDQDQNIEFDTTNDDGYWHPNFKSDSAREFLPNRPLFTMGKGATMSMGIVLAYKTVPLPTVLESLWQAESERAKKMPGKDGLCFNVIYGGGNRLEALMNGGLLTSWWDCVRDYATYGDKLSPVLYKLAEILPKRAMVTETGQLFAEAATVVMMGRDDQLDNFKQIKTWLNKWEDWARGCLKRHFKNDNWEQQYLAVLKEPWKYEPLPPGCHPDDLGNILRFTAFWVDKRVERYQWGQRHD